MPHPLAEAIHAMVEPRAPAAGAGWLGRTLRAIESSFDHDAFVTAFAAAGRRLGRAAVIPTDAEREDLRRAGLVVDGHVGGADEWGRGALLLVALACLPERDHAALVDELYRKGEVREREAVLRALPYLPAPERYVETAAEACRTNVRTVFEALACENPYPAAHLAELPFAHLVLKALFLETRIHRVRGLDARLGPELLRMVESFASERRAAGRPLSADAQWLLGLRTT